MFYDCYGCFLLKLLGFQLPLDQEVHGVGWLCLADAANVSTTNEPRCVALLPLLPSGSLGNSHCNSPLYPFFFDCLRLIQTRSFVSSALSSFFPRLAAAVFQLLMSEETPISHTSPLCLLILPFKNPAISINCFATLRITTLPFVFPSHLCLHPFLPQEPSVIAINSVRLPRGSLLPSLSRSHQQRTVPHTHRRSPNSCLCPISFALLVT